MCCHGIAAQLSTSVMICIAHQVAPLGDFWTLASKRRRRLTHQQVKVTFRFFTPRPLPKTLSELKFRFQNNMKKSARVVCWALHAHFQVFEPQFSRFVCEHLRHTQRPKGSARRFASPSPHTPFDVGWWGADAGGLPGSARSRHNSGNWDDGLAFLGVKSRGVSHRSLVSTNYNVLSSCRPPRH
jgi:hypothetical protein